MTDPAMTDRRPSPLDRLIRFCLERKLVVLLLVVVAVAWGAMSAPFDWELGGLPRDPVPVDAIPDLGENQQIVFTEWAGRSPRDVEDQITYPLTAALLGIPGVRTVRSTSYFGFSTIYVIFQEEVEFYGSRSRVLEKLASLAADTLPEGVTPRLGPDATALGQIFWYTLEGRDPEQRPAGGWDPQELRALQDWYVRFELQAAASVSEVASVGGFVQEYQIDVDPDAMRAAGVRLEEVVEAVRMSNREVGARTIEVNRVEYVIRGLGFVTQLADLERAVITARDGVPIHVKDVARVARGPAPRRGALDKDGAEAVGGVVVVRYGANPLAAIRSVKAKIAQIAPGLPEKTLPDGTRSKVTVVPFYDRTGLIHETLGTLNRALLEEILVAILVVLVMVRHFRSSVLIAGLLPLAVLICFIAMKAFGVDANVVALSGIAIAIGTMVDMGIILTENILRKLEEAAPQASRLEVVYEASREVGGAVLTAIATTVVGFLPVFTLEAAEGKLFRPLAYTKTFALIASVIVALAIIPAASHLLLARRVRRRLLRSVLASALLAAGVGLALGPGWWRAGALLVLAGAWGLAAPWLGERVRRAAPWATSAVAALVVAWILAEHWLVLGPERSLGSNFAFVVAVLGGVLLFFQVFERSYPALLRLCLRFKPVFLAVPIALLVFGAVIWLGLDRMFGWLPEGIRTAGPVARLAARFPGLGKEFMPDLDEGSFLYMPSTMPHASIGEALDVLRKQDLRFRSIPEIAEVVGKIGRVESALDPAPISMVETILNYRPEFVTDRAGNRVRFRFAPGETDLFRDEAGQPLPAPDGGPYRVRGRFARDGQGRLIPDAAGRPFRQWRPPLDPALNAGRAAWPGIRRPDDIWQEIVRAGEILGSTSAPKLQPIRTRLVMLQSGMRAPMGIKVKGPDLETIERVGLALEAALQEVPGVNPAAVIADRIIGKPYLEIAIDRDAIARHGIPLARVHEVIEVAIGGKRITTTVEGRERYPVRVRYLRELRDRMEALDRILVAAPGGAQIPLAQLAEIRYVRGPQAIKSEDGRLVGYVLFDRQPDRAEVEVVEAARAHIQMKIDHGQLEIPPGVSYAFAGTYENQVRAEEKLRIVLPLALLVIFLVLYLHFRAVSTTLLIFSGVAVAWAGGFILLWLYAQPWFLDVTLFGTNLRDLFQVRPFNLSVAVWVGFLALFGIATDDGVVMGTYLDQSFRRQRPRTVAGIRAAVVAAGTRRIRPCLMTTATTVLALLPVLTSTGRGADIMVPMAIPSIGGMLFAIITLFVVPVLYCAIEEARLALARPGAPAAD
ncbi:MAG: efflux RND transporter permease subunit [Planctomycetes bacterium]|nr:efflux RND transporter permease subunit [Planctomycetota bacterium]